MNLFIQTLIESIIQVVVFSIIPIIWWLITSKKEKSFWYWIGLKKIRNAKENRTVVWMVSVSTAFLLLLLLILYTMRNVETATSDFSGLGVAALPAILIYAIFKTALSEEFVFRGFILKRVSVKFGFHAGNMVQCILFGLMHGVMFFSVTSVINAVLITLFTSGIGWCMGYINEKKAEGSILPSWCIHAAANIFSGICSAFMLFA